jgi:upstream activation factor subunit UAF30
MASTQKRNTPPFDLSAIKLTQCLAVPPEVEASYSAIIDGILESSDLNTISAKAIRKGLQSKVDYDLSAQKVLSGFARTRQSLTLASQAQINELIIQRFDKFNADNQASTDSPPAPAPAVKPPTKTTTNGANGSKKRSSPSDDEPDTELSTLESSPPPKKKHKKSVELSDAALAAKLQAEENVRTSRATRGGSTKRKTPVKKVKKERKKKSRARVGSDDDSDAESGDKKEPKPRTGGFHVSSHSITSCGARGIKAVGGRGSVTETNIPCLERHMEEWPEFQYENLKFSEPNMNAPNTMHRSPSARVTG